MIIVISPEILQHSSSARDPHIDDRGKQSMEREVCVLPGGYIHRINIIAVNERVELCGRW